MKTRWVVAIIFISLALSACDFWSDDANNENNPNNVQLSSKLDKINIKLINPVNEAVSNPLPMIVEGNVENYTSLGYRTISNTHMYVVQKSQGEIIYHIQPELVLSSEGRFKGQVWLGNENYGNGEMFELNIILTQKRIKLQVGDNPVNDIPKNYYLKKFLITRND